MAEYIDGVCRRCFHSYVCEQFNEHRNENNEKCHFYNDHFVPAADVAPVVHGRWEQMKVFRTQYVCSECGDLWPDFRSDYCPNCGARMDGE